MLVDLLGGRILLGLDERRHQFIAALSERSPRTRGRGVTAEANFQGRFIVLSIYGIQLKILGCLPKNAVVCCRLQYTSKVILCLKIRGFQAFRLHFGLDF